MMLFLLFVITSVAGLTEVILTRNQFNDFVAEMEKISIDINMEDANVTVDLLAIETLIKEQNIKLDNMITGIGAITTAIHTQTESQQGHYDEWYQNFERVMTPINQLLTSVNNAIGVLKDTVQAIQSIFEAFQGTQDEAVATIETNVETIAANFEVGMKGIVAEAMAGAEMSFTAVECAAFEGDACEYEPLGFGPVVCEGTEIEACQIEGIVLEPVFKDGNPKEGRPKEPSEEL